MTSDVTLSNAVTQAQQTQQQSVQLAEDFDDFLILLTTQLQNQDPLNPMDSKEFTDQIVQFTQVEQSINMNAKLDDLIGLQLSTVPSTALGYVGLDVSYVSSELNFDGQTPVTINYALADVALDAQINIRDEDGNVVFSSDAPKTAGKHEFKWDGSNNGGDTVDPGTYSVTIDALDSDDDPIDTTTIVSGNVRGIETQNGIIFLLIGDRAVPVANVLNAAIPETADTGTDESTEGEQV